MGMFDSVFATCPNCGSEVEFQSKAGACDLKRYHSSSVPLVIANDLNGSSEKCLDCGESVSLSSPIIVARIKLDVAICSDQKGYD